LPRLLFTKYAERYAAALTAGCGFTLRSTNPSRTATQARPTAPSTRASAICRAVPYASTG
jgi:outer membrane lipopolysaccharide assembly protein LptE/RlpB